MTESVSESELVARLRRRQAGAFELLYARHRDAIWRFLRRLTGDDDRAADLFQETWLAAARHAHRLAGDSRPLPWLYTIARNKQRNALRLRLFDERRGAASAAEPPPPAATPDEETDLRARARAVAAAFDRLAEAHREVLLLCAVQGLDAPAAAAVLDIREDAVRKRLSRARAELRRLAGFDTALDTEESP